MSDYPVHPALPGNWPRAPRPADLSGQNILIWGIGKHGGGLAAARHCARHGAMVALLDRDPPAERIRQDVDDIGLPVYQGDLTHSCVKNADWIVISPAISPRVLSQFQGVKAAFTSAEGLFDSAHTGQRIALTGTKGKTTTSHLLGTLLNWPVAGNSNEPLLDLLHRLGPETNVICELSSFQLRYLSQQRFRCTYAGITTLDSDHLDWHDSREEYHQAKIQLTAWAQYVAFGASVELTERPFDLRSLIPDYEHLIPRIISGSQFQLMGAHNIQNAALSLRIALHLGIDEQSLQIRLGHLAPLEHRLQPVHQIGHITFLNDSIATNPLASMAALNSLHGPVALILGGSDKGADFSALIQRITSRTDPTYIHAIGETGPQLAQDFRKLGFPVLLHPSLADAVRSAYADLREHDEQSYVLLSPACASFGLFEDFADRGNCFSAIARRIDR